MLVKRGAKTDRPAAVDPKAFFEPGRTDWTAQEERFAYGDAWRIATPAVVTTERLSPGSDPTIEQIELAAVVFTNAQANDDQWLRLGLDDREGPGVLELTATVHTDAPVLVTLVDEAGRLLSGANAGQEIQPGRGGEPPAGNR